MLHFVQHEIRQEEYLLRKILQVCLPKKSAFTTLISTWFQHQSLVPTTHSALSEKKSAFISQKENKEKKKQTSKESKNLFSKETHENKPFPVLFYTNNNYQMWGFFITFLINHFIFIFILALFSGNLTSFHFHFCLIIILNQVESRLR